MGSISRDHLNLLLIMSESPNLMKPDRLRKLLKFLMLKTFFKNHILLPKGGSTMDYPPDKDHMRPIPRQV